MKITYNACRDNMGECTDAEYNNFKTAVATAMQSEFTAAEIRVGDSDFCNASQIEISEIHEDIDRDAVENLVRQVYESYSWLDAA